MKIRLLTLVGLFTLSACAQVASPLSPSVTVENPTSTKSVVTHTRIPSQTLYPTPTEWIKVYPIKKALVIYGTSWRNQYTLNFIMWGDFYLEPYLVLYEDGQLIFGLGDTQKQLSQQDTEAILAKLEDLGFLQLQNTYAAGTEASLYNFPNKVMPNPDFNLPSVVVTVNGQEFRYRKEWENYLIPPMKDIISYLKSLSSAGATPYQPERLLVGAREAERIPDGEIVIPWPEDVSSPINIFYLEGIEALKLYQSAEGNLIDYFSYEGENYEVYLRPILPHECHVYHYSEVNLPPTARTPFTCDDW